MLTQSERQATFQAWLFNLAGQTPEETDIIPTGGSLNAYIRDHGRPKKLVHKDSVRVAAYDGKLVGEVEGEAFVFRASSDD